MTVKRFCNGGLDENCYVVSDGGKAFVIDPGEENQAVYHALEGLVVEYILLTHGHYDHIGGVAWLAEKTGAKIVAHEDERIILEQEGMNLSPLFGAYMHLSPDRVVTDGELLEVGRMQVRVLHTPGHTAGSVCYLCDGVLVSGDTLFAQSIGRTDFPTGSMTQMHKSLYRLTQLDGRLRVLSGHGDETTIAEEIIKNPYMREQDDAF